jgi:hypothetical protein
MTLYNALDASGEEQLEHLIDKHGLSAVTSALATIAYAKGQHLRENWQDAPAARVWEADARRIEKCAAAILAS